MEWKSIAWKKLTFSHEFLILWAEASTGGAQVFLKISQYS